MTRRARIPAQNLAVPQRASFINMNIGKTDVQDVTQMAPETAEVIRQIMANDQGWLPGTNVHADIFRPLDARNNVANGAAWFHFTPEPGEAAAPYIVGVCCWNPRLSKEVWGLAHARYRALHRELNRDVLTPEIPTAMPLDKPPAGAWMAEIIYKSAQDLDVEAIGLMKRSSRAIFWSLAGALTDCPS